MTFPAALSVWGLFPGPNVQVTSYKKTPDSASRSRSECDLAVDPTDPRSMIAASKRFIDNQKYTFTIATAYSNDGGSSWTDSEDLWVGVSQGWIGYTDPALAFDDKSAAFLLAEPIGWDARIKKQDIYSFGMQVFRSTDAGASWSVPPIELDRLGDSDKQWAASDTWESSPYKGSVYLCWGAETPLRFARSSDGGLTWHGVGSEDPGAEITSADIYAPAICVSSDGTIHIAWHNRGADKILSMESIDGGNTFSPPEVVVDGITDIDTKIPVFPVPPFPTFPGGTFRVATLVTIAPLGARGCVIAWADCRGSFSRIYYRVRDTDGTWSGDPSGRALLASLGISKSLPVQHFHPQLAVNKSGQVACAFYEFGEKHPDNAYRIDVRIASSSYFLKSPFPVDFFHLATVTEQAWDPAIDAPLAHGNPDNTFIGEYFGLDAAGDDFCVLWTDTRTGKQELWFSKVATFRPPVHSVGVPTAMVGVVSAGVKNDGGGWVWWKQGPHGEPGPPNPVPPGPGPQFEILRLLAAYDIVVSGKSPERHRLGREILKAISKTAAAKTGSATRSRDRAGSTDKKRNRKP